MRIEEKKQSMSANKFNSGGSSRVERLLKEREQRRLNRASNGTDNGNMTDDSELNLEAEPPDSVPETPNKPDWESYNIPSDDSTTSSPSSNNSTMGLKGGLKEGYFGRRLGTMRGMKHRLLVVANRLPVSAVRRGEDSWSLEISAGGLVSALLGAISSQF
jgi:trehalose 6-phosphate synthase/phosphatase